ncbi:MAG: apolipoprotein N-acyltransferase [Desulfobulbaceae bacterium]|nr:apolipoprotein N-acyltransferase [Desulfobulbaceae bacterium]
MLSDKISDCINHPVSLALLSALLLAVAMPFHFGYWPLLAVAITPLLHLTACHTPGKALLGGFLAGVIHYIILLYWVVIAMGHYGGLPWWISVPALLILSCYMALYTALFCYLLCVIKKRSTTCSEASISFLWSAPFLWIALDYLRGKLLTGLPWMDLGYGLFEHPLLIQAADLGGHHLITFIIIVINLLIHQLIWTNKEPSAPRCPNKLLITTSFFCFLIFIGGYSQLRYNSITKLNQDALHIHSAVIQGNISQDEKWTPQKKESTVSTYRDLTHQALEDGNTELVIWPETAIPFFPQIDPLFYEIKRLAKTSNIDLLAGAPFFTKNTETTPPSYQYFNSALLINSEGNITEHYNKQHLVPFGEYVPLRRFFPFLEPLVENVGDFQPGTSLSPLSSKVCKLGVLVCFESIFPDLARKMTQNGADLLVNLTNDAWYGISSAPYHTLAMAVFRAVENRRSLVRAANTGISCLIEPTGNIQGQTQLFQPAIVSITAPLLTEKSFFTRAGFLFGPLCLFIAGIRLLLLFKKKEEST